MAEKLERVYNVNLRSAYNYPRTVRARKALIMLRAFVERHMKAAEATISNALNHEIWRNGMQKPPIRVRIKAVREDGKVSALLFGEDEAKAAGEKRRGEKKKKAADKRGKREREKKEREAKKTAAPAKEIPKKEQPAAASAGAAVKEAPAKGNAP